MKKIYTLLIILSIFAFTVRIPNALQLGGDNDHYLIYKRYVDSKWMNLTIVGLHYNVTTDIGKIYSGDLISDPWPIITQEADAAHFYSILETSVSPKLILTIADGDKKNTVFFENPTHHYIDALSQLLISLDNVFNRLTGYDMINNVWPVDISTVVMESYPEQYSTTVLIQRANDWLTVVVDINVTLVVGLVEDDDNLSWATKVLYKQVKEVSINSGGQSIIVQFDYYSLNEIDKSVSYGGLGFAVYIGDGNNVPTIYSIPNKLPFIGYANTSNITVTTIESNTQSIPITIFDLFLLPLFILAYKKYKHKLK